MRTSRQQQLVGWCLCAAALWVAAPARAGLTYVSQTRAVVVADRDYESEDRRDAAGFGPFDGALHFRFQRIVPVDVDEVRATQSSRLGETFIRASGRVEADSDLNVMAARSLLDVTFDVPADTPYTLASSLRPELDYGSGHFGPEPLYTLQLRRVGAGGGLLVDERLEQDLSSLGKSVSRSGRLAAGRYELLLDINSEAARETEVYTYNLDFSTGRGDGPAAVPLPPAVWGGLLLMGAIAAARARSARVARAG